MSGWKKSSSCRLMARILVFLMLLQGMSLWELSLSYEWVQRNYVTKTLNRVISVLNHGAVHAAAPLADAGGNRSLNKNRPLGADMVMDGTGSSDSDGDPLTCQWYGPFADTSGQAPSVEIPEGTYTVSLAVDDGTSGSDIDMTTVEIIPCFNISARAKSGKVQLTWSHIEGTERYDVYRTDEFDPFNFVKIAETTSTYSTYLDATVQNENTYLYVVGALSQGVGCFSNVISSHPTAVRSRTPINYHPVLYSTPVTHGTVGIVYNYDVNATDPNGDVLIYSLLTSPAGMNIDFATGLINWTPGQAGSFDITMEVSDGNGETDNQIFTAVIEVLIVPVTVPAILGQPQADAEAAIRAAGLIVGTVTTTNSNTVPSGSVISQNPVGGTSIAEGSAVDLGVSLGPVMVTVPDVVGQPQADAEAAILAASLVVGTITTANSDTVPAGSVISQNPKNATEVPEDTAVDLVVSLGALSVDLTVTDIDIASLNIDGQTLKISGTSNTVIRNLGDQEAFESYWVAIFEDSNGSRSFEPLEDSIIGAVQVDAGPGAGSVFSIDVPVNGEVRFKGNEIFACVDSNNEINEINEDNNILGSTANCEMEPIPSGIFDPVVEWRFSSTSIGGNYSIPVVIRLKDTNEDGALNDDDIPFVLFVANGYLYAARGDTGEEEFRVYVRGGAEGSSQIAAGDIDNDGFPEIIVLSWQNPY